MMMPVQVRESDGRYHATLLGLPGVCGVGFTRDEAVLVLQTELAAREQDGRLVWMDILTPRDRDWRRPPTPEEIEITREMVAEIYRERDAQKAAEFPE